MAKVAKDWYRIAIDAAQSTADIHISDFVGGWVDEFWYEGGGPGVLTHKGFMKDLEALPESVKSIKVHINSPGGDVFGGVAIANALRAQRAQGRKVETIVEGLAASIASVIAMAGEPVTMSDTALMMIHNPWSCACGSAAEMRKAAEELDKIRDASLVPAYQWHTDMDAAEIVALMDATTWMDADEAIEMGFATAKIDGLKAAASITPKALEKLAIPEKYQERVLALVRAKEDASDGDQDAQGSGGDAADGSPVDSAVPVAAPASDRDDSISPADLIELCGTADLDLAFARSLVAEHLTTEQARQRIQSEQSRRQAEAARCEQITAMCGKAGHDDLAGDMVATGMTFKAACDLMTKFTAKLDCVEIDAGLKPDHSAKRGPVIDVQAIYAKMNGLTTLARKE